MSDIRLVKPCLTNSERLMGEARLCAEDGRPVSFDEGKLKQALAKSGLEFKFSESLGIANIKLADKIVILSKSGKVVVRLAKDREDIKSALNRIAEIVWPAARAGGAKAPKF